MCKNLHIDNINNMKNNEDQESNIKAKKKSNF